MRELATLNLRRFSQFLMTAVFVVCSAKTAMARYPLVKNIVIKDNPLSVTFEMTGSAPVKVIRIGDKEVLVAIKDAVLANDYKIKGHKSPVLTSVNVETLDGPVVAVVVTGKNPYGKIESAFNKAKTRFVVALDKGKKAVSPAPKPLPEPVTPVPKKKSEPRVSAKPRPAEIQEKKSNQDPAGPLTKASQSLGEKKPAPIVLPKVKEKSKSPEKERSAVPPVYVPPNRTKGEFKGDISDLYRGPDPLQGCQAKPVENALLLAKKELYPEAYEILEQYMLKENFSCLEQVYYLKAYVYYKSIENEDYASLIKAERIFQDALVSYPKSSYVPFAYAAMGMIQVRLKNLSAAEGFFNIVRQGYPGYNGMPEVLYHLAGIYDQKGYTDKALRLYKQVFQSEMDNSYITDAGVGYGKALFNKRQYFDALSVLNYVVKNDIKKVYESPDLLMHTANANFELGLSKPARQTYIRLLNLFPDIPNRDMVLSRVGDAYGMENNEEKALKIYELVREKFPDSMGFINASIGIARYLTLDQEKVEIYEMIKTRFPENTYARIAMMRLAEIYQKNGEYNKCIQEIEDLLSTHPRGLRYEAVKLMQKAYESLFKEQLKAKDYTSILNRYELEHVKLDKMSSRLIAFRVGISYLNVNLHEQAFNQLILAYKQFKRSKRPPELLFGLGCAMDESGRKEDGLKLLASFSKRFPKHPKRIEALTRMGKIHFKKGRLKKADAVFKTAYSASNTPFSRGEILMHHAFVHEKKGNLKTASELQTRAVKEFAAAPGQNYETLAKAYKRLGNTYLNLKSYVQAADAFSKALGFSQGDRAKANIGFLLGDAYQKGNVMDKAKQTFEQVVESYDSVWARMARQRLDTMTLTGKMINS